MIGSYKWDAAIIKSASLELSVSSWLGWGQGTSVVSKPQDSSLQMTSMMDWWKEREEIKAYSGFHGIFDWHFNIKNFWNQNWSLVHVSKLSGTSMCTARVITNNILRACFVHIIIQIPHTTVHQLALANSKIWGLFGCKRTIKAIGYLNKR